MPSVSGSKYLVQAGWNDVPHLTGQAKEDVLASTPPYLRDARSKGIPSLGAGAIYPVAESDIMVPPFIVPAHWPRCYSLDVGWICTAVIWGALDRSVDCWYLFAEHYRGQAEPSVHAAAIRARGEWIPGLIDPAARGRAQSDGERLIVTYGDLGLNLTPYKNAVEAGLYECWYRMTTGRLKVFSTCTRWFNEYRLYHRDEKGEVVKKNDHLMDASRGLVMSGRTVARVAPNPHEGMVGSAAGGDPSIGY